MLTVSGRLLKVQSRNLPAARNFSSGLRAIFMQSTPGPGAGLDLKGGPLAPFGPELQSLRRCASPSGGDSPGVDPATRKIPPDLRAFDAQSRQEEPGGGPPGLRLRSRGGGEAPELGRRRAPALPTRLRQLAVQLLEGGGEAAHRGARLHGGTEALDGLGTVVEQRLQPVREGPRSDRRPSYRRGLRDPRQGGTRGGGWLRAFRRPAGHGRHRLGRQLHRSFDHGAARPPEEGRLEGSDDLPADFRRSDPRKQRGPAARREGGRAARRREAERAPADRSSPAPPPRPERSRRPPPSRLPAPAARTRRAGLAATAARARDAWPPRERC